jgi:hypothetical protein
VANGCGACTECQAAHRCKLEDDLNGGMEEEEWGGRNADEGVVPERDEVEDEQGGGEDAVAGEAEFLMFESAVNQFLLAAPMKPEVLGKDAWPVAIAPPLKMSAAHRDCVLSANTNLMKAIKMGKQVYKKAHDNHVSFLKIINQGALLSPGPARRRPRLKLISRRVRPPLLLRRTVASSRSRKPMPKRRHESS